MLSDYEDAKQSEFFNQVHKQTQDARNLEQENALEIMNNLDLDFNFNGSLRNAAEDNLSQYPTQRISRNPEQDDKQLDFFEQGYTN
jgi:hypothetical protein